MFKITYLTYILVLLIFISCSSTKSIKIKDDIIPMNRTTLSLLIRDSALNYKAIKFNKLTLSINNNNQTSTYRGSLRVIKDSSIWISLNAALGIEAVRLLLTRDSVFIIDRYHKKTYSGGYEYFEDKIGFEVNYKLIQSLLFNEFISYESCFEVTKTIKYNSIIEDRKYVLVSMNERKFNRTKRKIERKIQKSKNPSSIIYQENYIDPHSYRVENIYVKELYKDWDLFVKYSNFKHINKKLFSYLVQFNFNSLNTKFSLDVNYSGVNFVEEVSMPFRIPNNYEQIK